MKVTVKTVSDRITILENQKTRSLNEDFQLAVYRWALELKGGAEAAEAQLAELAKQEAVADVVPWNHPNEERTCDVWLRKFDLKPGELFYRPAPAADLAELVPDEISPDDAVKILADRYGEFGIDHHLCCDSFEVGANWRRSQILRNIEVSQNGETTPAAKVDSLGKSEVRTQNQALDEKRVDFIQSLAEDPALLSGKSGQLKYRFDQHWFAVDGCRETVTHYVARLRENGVVTHYAKSLYDFREDGEQ